MSEIDLSPEALKKRRELAEKATPGPWACNDNVEELFNRRPNDWWDIYANSKNSVGAVIAQCSQWGATKEEQEAARELFWKTKKTVDPGISGHNARHIAANSPDAVIAMIDEIERLRKQLNDCKSQLGDAKSRNMVLSEDKERLRKRIIELDEAKMEMAADGLYKEFMKEIRSIPKGCQNKLAELQTENNRLQKQLNKLLAFIDTAQGTFESRFYNPDYVPTDEDCAEARERFHVIVDRFASLSTTCARLEKEADWLCQHMNIDGIFTTGCPAIIDEDECDDDCPKCWRKAARKSVEAGND